MRTHTNAPFLKRSFATIVAASIYKKKVVSHAHEWLVPEMTIKYFTSFRPLEPVRNDPIAWELLGNNG